MPVIVSAEASDKPMTGDGVIREAQEAVTATKDYTIQQKDAFQRKVQTELHEMQAALRSSVDKSRVRRRKYERTSRRRSRN
jgi:hypothetical protein